MDKKENSLQFHRGLQEDHDEEKNIGLYGVIGRIADAT